MSASFEDIELLKEQHSELDKRLKEENERPFPNFALIQQYEKEKLKLKEKIQKEENEFFKATS